MTKLCWCARKPNTDNFLFSISLIVLTFLIFRPGDFDIEDDDLPFEEFEFGLDAACNPIDEANLTDTPIDGVPKVTEEAGCDELVNSILCISFLQQIIALTKIKVTRCIEKECMEDPHVEHSFVGSALYLQWVSYSIDVSYSGLGIFHL